MKKDYNMRVMALLTAMLLAVPMSWAFNVDGMSYEVNNEAAKTVTLTKGMSSPTNVLVPETVSYNGNTIGESAVS